MDTHESRLGDLKWIFSEWILDSFFSGILDSKDWSQMPSIPDSTSKHSLDSGIWITLHGAKHYYENTLAACNRP